MSKRKSTFVREIQRMDRRESWRNKHVRKETNRTGGDTTSEEPAQPAKGAEEAEQVDSAQ